MGLIEISGNVQSRFMQAAALLHLLDPVRGEAAAHGLDTGSNAFEQRERLLKRKLLDSFALIFATRKDGDSVSATALEEGHPDGTMVRIASNDGISDTTLRHLQSLVDVLNNIAGREFDAAEGETEILRRIISLDLPKVRHYVKDLRSVGDDVVNTILALRSRPAESMSSEADTSRYGTFTEWLQGVLAIKALPLDVGPDGLIALIKWALEAKRTFLAPLKATFPANGKRRIGLQSFLKYLPYSL